MNSLIDILKAKANQSEIDCAFHLQLVIALHGMLIAAEVVAKDSKISGQELIRLATKYLKTKGL